MIFTISGLHGCGKTTVAKKIAEALGLKYYSTGQAFRDLAKEKNMTLEEFTKYVENNPNIDKILDDKIVAIAKSRVDTLIDSQLAPYLLKDLAIFKILLTCPLETRIKRMAERDQVSYDQKLKETTLREDSELERFKTLYNIDLQDEKNWKIYDIIVDTKRLNPEELTNKILRVWKKKSKEKRSQNSV